MAMWECDLCLHTPVDGLTADESYPRTQNFSKGECLMSNDTDSAVRRLDLFFVTENVAQRLGLSTGRNRFFRSMQTD